MAPQLWCGKIILITFELVRGENVVKPLGNALRRRWRLVVASHELADIGHVSLLAVRDEVVAKLEGELLDDVRASG